MDGRMDAIGRKSLYALILRALLCGANKQMEEEEGGTPEGSQLLGSCLDGTSEKACDRLS